MQQQIQPASARGLLFLFVLFMAAFLGWAHGASAADVSISATVAGTTPPAPSNPVVEFRGIAAPSAAVTVKRGTTAAGATTALADASFSVRLTEQPAGQQTFEVSATDVAGAALTAVSFALTLESGTTTIITGVFLGPSIALDKASVTKGEMVTVSGRSAPNSSITVTVQSVRALSLTATADAAGIWSRQVETDALETGNHAAKARATSGSVVSAYSATVNFAVTAASEVEPEPEPEPDPAAGKPHSDLNLDDDVNIVDFSILLFYWKQKNPKNPRADINKDGVVDIVDFSILLYQWTG